MELMKEPGDLIQARLQMVAQQIKGRGIVDVRVLGAMSEIPRQLFISADLLPDAYDDHPLPIGHGQTISQPYIVALMTSLLKLKGNEKVLEIGTGSGYQAALLGKLAAQVHTVERIPELVEAANASLSQLGMDNVHVHLGDGSLGWPAEAPYDGILVSAASPEVPACLPEQLAPGGKLVIPVGARWRQMLQVWEMHGNKLEKKEILPVVFVPLRGEKGWQDSDW